MQGPEVKQDSWTLVLIKAMWPWLTAALVLVSAVIAMAWPERMAAWGQALPLLVGLVAAMGTAAWGGPVLKRKQTTDTGLKNDGR